MNILWMWMIGGIVLVGVGLWWVFDLTDDGDEWVDDSLDALRRIT